MNKEEFKSKKKNSQFKYRRIEERNDKIREGVH